MVRRVLTVSAMLSLAVQLVVFGNPAQAQSGSGSWQFAVSGDSRNCGDVVMPGIAASVLKHKPAFYWHLGDFRKIYDFDEDMLHEPEHASKRLSISEYLSHSWEDFIENQIEPFGSLPVFLGIGNHEIVLSKTRDEYIAQFADWLNSPILRNQRLQDNRRDHKLKTYYHWVENGVDFINLDNATHDQFDGAQVRWVDRVLDRDASDSSIKTVVVGMHAALPDSISAGHSMNEWPAGEQSGRRVYEALLNFKNRTHKYVYVLASHSHYYMDGIFNTEYWRTHGGVLPGWIIGTAGAIRYPLPPNAKDARAAETNVYGYLLGTVSPNGEIRFEFQRLREADIPTDVVNRFTAEFVYWCFAENNLARQP